MGRRGHGEGTIYRRRDGRWTGAITLEGGKRKQVYGRTRQEVQTKLAAARRDAEAGATMGDARQTVRDYLASWLQSIRPTIRTGSWVAYEKDVRVHIVPALGHLRLAKLSAQHVQTFYSELLSDGMSPSTVVLVHTVLRKALKDAVRLGLIPRNVSTLVNVPRREEREIEPWTEEQARIFLDHVLAMRPEDYALYLLALATGMRLGELLALRWRCVDLARGTVRVEHTLDYSEGGGIFRLAPPKTDSARRQIKIADDVRDTLRSHRTRQNAERLRMGPAWQDNDLVFCNAVGGFLHPRQVASKHLDRLAREAGVPRLRFHDLRHTAATIALGRGIPTKVVSEMLGHSSPMITAGRYQHVQAHMQERLSEEMGRALVPRPESASERERGSR